MAELPFFPLAIDAYLADCGHLTDAEHGRYLLILMELWRAPHCRLPNDDAWLARRFRRTVEAVQSELRPLLAEFCQSDGNWITQKRLSKEFSRARKVTRQRSDAAKSLWRKKKGGSERIREETHPRIAPAYEPTPTPTPTEVREDSLSQPGRAAPLPPNWVPSEVTLDRARKARPDIQPARLKLETQGFISRKRSDNAHSHNWDEAFIGWILKTTVTEHRTDGTQRTGQPQRRGGTSTRAAYLAHFGGLGSQGSDRPPDGSDEPELVGSASLADPK